MSKTMKFRLLLRIVISVLLFTMSIGCTTSEIHSDQPGKIAAAGTNDTLEARLERQSKRFSKTVAGGAVVGAVIGGVALALITGEAEYAAAGAAVGAAAGAATGRYVATKQQEYAVAADRIDSMIVDVNTESRELTAYLATAREYVAQSKLDIDRLNRLSASAQQSGAKAKSQLAAIIKNRNSIAAAVSGLKQSSSEYRFAAEAQKNESGENSVAALNSEINVLDQSIRSLESELDALDSALRLSQV